MRDDRIAELGLGEVREHSRLHRDHNLIGLGPDHRKAENAVAYGFIRRQARDRHVSASAVAAAIVDSFELLDHVPHIDPATRR
jgi:hypothetical protein